MKVDMDLIHGKDGQTMDDDTDAAGMDVENADSSEGELDESDRHSRLKTFLLVAAMIGGFGLFVWNMTGLVNNMRLDNQGYPVNIVYEMENLDDFRNGAEGSAATTDTGQTEEVTTDAVRDGPGPPAVQAAEDTGTVKAPDGDAGTTAAMQQEMQDIRNENALLKQELKNAEDMLDSALERLDAINKGY